MRHLLLPIVAAFYLINAAQAHDSVGEEDPKLLGEIIVEGRSENLVGIADSASEGKIGREILDNRPLLRSGELLENVPGLIVTQHSGDGKANQFFLRGFNLDHGTDFRTSVDGMPVNMPTHAHGQGYTDLNFIIPELVDHIDFKKGVYYAEEGDFSAAGAADMHLMESLPKGIFQATYGEYGYGRTLFADSRKTGEGTLLSALTLGYYDGPWEVNQKARSYNGLIRFSRGDRHNGANLTFLAYANQWNATDQIPRRAVESGALSEFGNLDSTDGGRTSRYSLSGEYRRRRGDEKFKAHFYAIAYRLDLYSNFTYFLDDPVNGDQFAQLDRRAVIGGALAYSDSAELFGYKGTNTFGVQLRNDIIPSVALLHTKQRQTLETVRDDQVYEGSLGLYAKNETQWEEKLRTNFGLRGDLFEFNIDSSNNANSGNELAAKLSPKGSVVFGPWFETELYLSGGLGFHSNDARGTTITVDPKTGEETTSVDPLVLAKGAEFGIRSAAVPNLNSTLSFWVLDLSSELIFVGDAGITEPNRGSRRVGIEFANFYQPTDWLTLDADYSVSRARFDKSQGEGDRVPGSIDDVVSAGAAASVAENLLASIRLRYFGPRPLIEDNSVRSGQTFIVNSRLAYSIDDLSFSLDILNMFDSNDHDIDYFYASRLVGEPIEGVEDVHFHPIEPRAFRGTVSYRF